MTMTTTATATNTTRSRDNILKDVSLGLVAGIQPKRVTAPHPEHTCRICDYDRTYHTTGSCAFCGCANP